MLNLDFDGPEVPPVDVTSIIDPSVSASVRPFTSLLILLQYPKIDYHGFPRQVIVGRLVELVGQRFGENDGIPRPVKCPE